MSISPAQGIAPPSTEESLAPLSDHEFKIYNHMAVGMDIFHNGFRRAWNMIWEACCNDKIPDEFTTNEFLNEGFRFLEHLTVHHSIEESRIFPMLGKRMPEFRGDLQAQHEEIHAGMEKMETYLIMCKTGQQSFQLSELKLTMESWGTILWTHLDDEVKALGAENMRKYWSKDEVMRLRL